MRAGDTGWGKSQVSALRGDDNTGGKVAEEPSLAEKPRPVPNDDHGLVSDLVTITDGTVSQSSVLKSGGVDVVAYWAGDRACPLPKERLLQR